MQQADATPHDPPQVRRRQAEQRRRSWSLIAPRHQIAWNVWQACADEVRIVVRSSDKVITRILPSAVSIAMREAFVPKALREETRAVVKLLHGIDSNGPASVPLMADACLGSGVGTDRETCPPGTPRCKCAWWFRKLEGAS